MSFIQNQSNREKRLATSYRSIVYVVAAYANGNQKSLTPHIQCDNSSGIETHVLILPLAQSGQSDGVRQLYNFTIFGEHFINSTKSFMLQKVIIHVSKC